MGKLISSMRVLNSSKKTIESGTELVLTMEIFREDGTKVLADGLQRTTETDKSISVVIAMRMRTFASPQETSPSETNVTTALMDTVKGEVEGDHRWDTVETTLITNGGIHKTPAQRLKRPLAHRQTELSDQEGADKVLASINSWFLDWRAANPSPPTLPTEE
jgi:hypothetical protein